MSNSMKVIDMVTARALNVLESQLVFCSTINRQYDDQFANKGGGQIGSQLRIREPIQVSIRTGKIMDAQDLTENSQTLTLATQKGVDLRLTSSDLLLTVNDFDEQILSPSISTLASHIDAYALSIMTPDVYNVVGTPGTTPATALVWLQGGQKLDEFNTPDNRRIALLSPAAQAATVNGLTTLTNPGGTIGEQYKKGAMGSAFGFEFRMSQNITSHTGGTRDNTTPVVNGASQTGASLICDGFDNGATVTVGDVFTIAGVYAVNPQSKVSTGSLQQFVVTAAGTADGSGNLTLSISPSITYSGPYQNVSALPGNDAALTFVGSASTAYPQNLVYHPDAFTMVTADLDLPKGVHMASRKRYKNISMRVLGDYNIINDEYLFRVDVLFGIKTLRPQTACRVYG